MVSTPDRPRRSARSQMPKVMMNCMMMLLGMSPARRMACMTRVVKTANNGPRRTLQITVAATLGAALATENVVADAAVTATIDQQGARVVEGLSPCRVVKSSAVGLAGAPLSPQRRRAGRRWHESDGSCPRHSGQGSATTATAAVVSVTAIRTRQVTGSQLSLRSRGEVS